MLPTSLAPYVRPLRERWLVIAGTLIVVLVAATAYGMLRPAHYTATLQTYVSAQTGDNPELAYMGAQLSEQRVKSYTEFAQSDTVLDPVIRQLALPMSTQQLAREVTATSSVDSVVIDIHVTDSSPERAAAIANAVGQTLSQLVGQLEKPPTGTQPPAVSLRIVQPAPVPVTPSNTSVAVLLVYGLLAGLSIGGGLALLVHALDNRVKTGAQLTATTSAPLLGMITRDDSLQQRPLLPLDRPGIPLAEAFRQLRTNLQYVTTGRGGKVLLVTSSLGGEGKTTTVLNLAQTLATAGHRVLVVDADLRRPQVGEVVGADPAVGLTSILSERCDLASAVQHCAVPFDVLPAGPIPPNPSELLGSEIMYSALAQTRLSYDVVLVDAPPVLPVTDPVVLAPATDGVILLCRHSSTTVPQLQQASEALSAGGADVRGCVLTVAPSQDSGHAYGDYTSSYLQGPEASAVPVAHRLAPLRPTTTAHRTSSTAAPGPLDMRTTSSGSEGVHPGPGQTRADASRADTSPDRRASPVGVTANGARLFPPAR